MKENMKNLTNFGSALDDDKLDSVSGGYLMVTTEFRCPNCGKFELFCDEQPEGRTCWVCGGQGIEVVMNRSVIREYVDRHPH